MTDPDTPVVGPEERTQPERRALTVPPDLEETLTQLAAVVVRLEKREQQHPEPNDSDDRLSQVESAVKWASPWRQLLGFVAFLAVGAVSVVTALGTYAKDAVVETMKEAHKAEEAPVEPSVQTVDALKTDVGSVKAGVKTLLQEEERRNEVKGIEVELEGHDEQYQLKLQDYSAKKARGREPDKPGKSDRHIQLEAKRKEVLNRKF